MLEMELGDIVICPKQPSRGQFTLARVTQKYRFDMAHGRGDFGHLMGVAEQVAIGTSDGPLAQSISDLFRRFDFRACVVRVPDVLRERVLEDGQKLMGRDEGAPSSGSDPVTARQERTEQARRAAQQEAARCYMKQTVDWAHQQFEAAVGEAFERKGYTRIGGNRYGDGGDADHVFSLPMPGLDDLERDQSYPPWTPVVLVQVKHKHGRDEGDADGIRQLCALKTPEMEKREWQIVSRILFSSANEFTPGCQRLAEEAEITLICGEDAGLFLL